MTIVICLSSLLRTAAKS